MKNYLLLIVSIFSLSISAQNWNPINLGSEYNYKSDTSQLITNTIFVDSFSLNNSDTILYLNRIMTDCDTCSVAGYKLINQPQFLMKQVLKEEDSLFIFQDPTEFKIYPLKNLNDTWVFDSINSINALIDSAYTDTIFGINDSIKRINLSNGSNIILSKSFGIIRFPITPAHYYELIGNNNPLGEQLLKFWDFFTYEVGDILQWKEWYGGAGLFGSTYYYSAIINSKIKIGDTAKYVVQGYSKKIFGPPPGSTTYTTFNSTLTFVDSMSHLSNSYPNQVFSNGLQSIRLEYSESVSYISSGLYIKEIDYVNSSHAPTAYRSILLKPTGSGWPYVKESKFTKNLGQCIYSRENLDIYYKCMQGRIHNGDTIGSIYPDSFYLISIEEINDNNLRIYPNPASDQIFIDSYHIAINKINIITITGKIIETVSTEFNKINVAHLPPGIYFIQLITDKRTITRKFVKH